MSEAHRIIKKMFGIPPDVEIDDKRAWAEIIAGDPTGTIKLSDHDNQVLTKFMREYICHTT